VQNINRIIMILRFVCENFLSIKDKVVLDFESKAIKEMSSTNLVHSGYRNIEILKSLFLLGKNASGKTNVMKAIDFMVKLILNSLNLDSDIFNQKKLYFKLDKSTMNKPSFFEILFVLEKTKYRYGFKILENDIVEEWLFYANKTKENEYFYRLNNEWKIDKKFDGQAKKISKITSDQNLFLSAVAYWKGDISTLILNWFKKFLFVYSTDIDYYLEYTTRIVKEENYSKAFRKIIIDSDLGFENFKSENKGSSSLSNVKKVLAEFDTKNFLLRTEHNVYENDKVVDKIYFNLMVEESLGTQKYVALLGPIIDSLFNNKVLIIDEMENKLDSRLFVNLIKLFSNNNKFKNNSQLLFSSHNTIPLKLKILRRDQYFIVTKNEYGASNLKTLYDLGFRSDASYEKEYYKGDKEGLPKLSQQLTLF